jgi:hypothetical protein
LRLRRFHVLGFSDAIRPVQDLSNSGFVFSQYYIDLDSTGNSGCEIVVPPTHLTEEYEAFKAPQLVFSTDCLPRSTFSTEFARIVKINFNTSTFNFSAPQTVILGSKTSIGLQVVRKLQERKISVLAIGDLSALDFFLPVHPAGSIQYYVRDYLRQPGFIPPCADQRRGILELNPREQFDFVPKRIWSSHIDWLANPLFNAIRSSHSPGRPITSNQMHL